MLILTRKIGEGIKIGDEITVRIVEVKGNQMKVGIEAPRNVTVHREEVYNLIQEENKLAAQQAPSVLSDITTLWKKKKV